MRNVGFSAMEHVAEVRPRAALQGACLILPSGWIPRQVNKRALENLARAGAFDSLEPDRAKALASAETLCCNCRKAPMAERESAQVAVWRGRRSGAMRGWRARSCPM
jgi:DNA polymerase-3 subunit alpha